MERRNFPERITIEVTNRCNLLCSFCPRHHTDMPLGDMSETLFRKIIDEAVGNLPVCAVLFFRGEPFLHPNIIEFITYAKQKGLSPLQIASNGLLLDEALGERIIGSGLDFISFSLDTIDPDIYKRSRKNGDLKTSMDNVIRFAKQCAAEKARGRKVPEIQVSTVAIEEYVPRQQEFIDFWRQYADRVRVYIEHSTDGNFGSISGDILDSKGERKPCRKIATDMVVYWDGTIALCNHDWHNVLEIGNAGEQTIHEIWNSEAYTAIVRMHETNEYDENCVCKNCDHWRLYYTEEKMLGVSYEKKPV